MPGRVQGKVALITGGGRGQGRSHAVMLAEEGADIIAIDILRDYASIAYGMSTAGDMAETARAVEARGRRIVTSKADVRDGAALRAAVDQGVARLGRLDIVCANAGVTTAQPWDQVTQEAWRDVLDTNLTGTWNTFTATIPHLIAAGGGSIIATSSVAGLKGQPFLAPYVASKWGITGLVKAMANELAEYGIRVNSIHPTGVDTPMAHGIALQPLIDAHPHLGPIFMNTMPGVTMTDVRDISSAVVYLASDEARYVTGLQLPIDAGRTIR